MSGILKTSTLKLHGTDGVDFSLKVEDDNFNIKRGETSLMSIGIDEESALSGEIQSNADKITISAPVQFKNDVTAVGDLGRSIELSKCVDVGSEEIYDRSKFEFAYGFNLNPFQKNQYLREISIAADAVPGSEAHSNPVYGYNEDGTIHPTGGKSKAYPEDFTAFKYKLHGPDDSEVITTTSENTFNVCDSIFSFFKERGFPFMSNDKTGVSETSYSMLNGDMDVVFDFKTIDGKRYLDLLYRNQPDSGGSSFICYLTTYAEPEDRKDFLYYPLRIPITTSYSEHTSLVDSNNDSVYYDLTKKMMTIKLSSEDHVYVNSTSSFENAGYDLTVYHSIKNLDATFAIKKQVASSKALESCTIENADVFIQVKDITCSEKIIQQVNGGNVKRNISYEEDETVNKQLVVNENGDFVGFVCPKSAGGDSRFDMFITDPGDLNGFATSNVLNAPSDNNATTLVEKGGKATGFYMWSSPWWSYVFPYISPELHENPPVPELCDGNQSVKEGTLASAPPETILALLLGHEFQHCISFSIGGIEFMDSEAQAVAVECDPRLNLGTVALFRPHAWLSYLLALHRGSWPSFANGRALPDDKNIIYPDYGASVFYMYLQSQFDKNHQIMRRINEIVSIDAYKNMSEDVINTTGAARPRFTGAQLAFKQAVQELFPEIVSDVFVDFCISSVILRPNEAIPQKYRSGHPYWFWSSKSENNKNGELGWYNDSRWWQDFDEAVVLEAEIGENAYAGTNPYRRIARDGPHFIGQTVTPTWPRVNLENNNVDYQVNSSGPRASQLTKEFMNMSMCAFLMPDALNSVNISVERGTLHVAVLKFGSTSDGVGTWMMDGVHKVTEGNSKQIDLLQFHNKPGKTQLVIVNNEIQEEPNQINNYLVRADDPVQNKLSGKCVISISTSDSTLVPNVVDVEESA